LVVSGNFIPGVSAPTCSLDTSANEDIPQIMLFAGKSSSNLLIIGNHLKRIKLFIKDWLKKQPNIRLVGGQPFALALVVQNTKN